MLPQVFGDSGLVCRLISVQFGYIVAIFFAKLTYGQNKSDSLILESR